MNPLTHLAFFLDTASTVPCASPAMNWWDIGRIGIAAALAGLLIFLLFIFTVKGVKAEKSLGNFVAFNSASFGVAGAAVVVMASRDWPTVLLVAGACLGVGFVFGLLFGYPLSNKPSPTGNGADNDEPAAQANLFQQSADSLSKIVAGATLVEAGKIFEQFKSVANAVSKYSNAGGLVCGAESYVFGAGVTLYFLILGFLTGLVLPHFYSLVSTVPGTSSQPDHPASTDEEQPPPNQNPTPPDQGKPTGGGSGQSNADEVKLASGNGQTPVEQGKSSGDQANTTSTDNLVSGAGQESSAGD